MEVWSIVRIYSWQPHVVQILLVDFIGVKYLIVDHDEIIGSIIRSC